MNRFERLFFILEKNETASHAGTSEPRGVIKIIITSDKMRVMVEISNLNITEECRYELAIFTRNTGSDSRPKPRFINIETNQNGNVRMDSEYSYSGGEVCGVALASLRKNNPGMRQYPMVSFKIKQDEWRKVLTLNERITREKESAENDELPEQNSLKREMHVQEHHENEEIDQKKYESEFLKQESSRKEIPGNEPPQKERNMSRNEPPQKERNMSRSEPPQRERNMSRSESPQRERNMSRSESTQREKNMTRNEPPQRERDIPRNEPPQMERDIPRSEPPQREREIPRSEPPQRERDIPRSDPPQKERDMHRNEHSHQNERDILRNEPPQSEKEMPRRELPQREREQEPEEEINKINKEELLYKHFTEFDPFNTTNKSYKWWRGSDMHQINRVLIEMSIRLPFELNKEGYLACELFGHILLGTYKDRVLDREFFILGIPAKNRDGVGNYYSNSRWEESGAELGTNESGYWLTYIDCETSKVVKVI